MPNNKKTLDTVKEQARIEAAIAERLATINKLKGEAITLEDKIATRTTARLKTYDKYIDILTDVLDKGKENIQQEIEYTNARLKHLATLDDLGKKYDEDEKRRLETKMGLLEEAIELTDAEVEARVKGWAVERKAIAETQQARNQAREGTELLIKTLTGVSNAWKSTFLGALVGSKNLAASLGGIAAALKTQLSLQNLLGSTMMKMQEATFEMVLLQDRVITDFRRSTAAGEEYEDVIVDVYHDTRQLGVSLEETSRATQALYENMANFTKLGQSAQAEITQLAVYMEGAGVSATEFSDNMNLMTKSLGMTHAEAQQLSMDLVKMGSEIGIPPKRLAQELKSAGKSLAKYGKDATRIFKSMAAQAKATGTATSQLLAITERFDTFEDAAQAAMGLNAILGGQYMDSLQMLEAEEPERLRMIQESLDASGQSWASMDRFQRNYIAKTLGGDMEAVAAVMSGNAESLREAELQAQGFTGTMEEMEAQYVNQVDITKKLTELKRQFAQAVEPIIDLVRYLVDTLLGWNEVLNGYLIPALGILLGLYVTWRILTNEMFTAVGRLVAKVWASVTAKAAETTAVEADTIAKGINTTATETMAVAQVTATKASRGLNWNILLFAAAIAIVIIALVPLVDAVAKLAVALKDSGDAGWMVIGVLIALGVVLVAMIATFAALAPATMTAAIPMLLFAAAIFIIAAGLSLVIYAVTGLVEVLLSANPNIMETALALGMIAFAAMGIALAGPFAAIGLFLMALGFGALALALAFIKTKDLEALGQMFTGLGNVMTSGQKFSELAPALKESTQTLLAMGTAVSALVSPFDAVASAVNTLVISLKALTTVPLVTLAIAAGGGLTIAGKSPPIMGLGSAGGGGTPAGEPGPTTLSDDTIKKLGEEIAKQVASRPQKINVEGKLNGRTLMKFVNSKQADKFMEETF